MNKLRVISWNIAVRGSIESKVDYVQSVINETSDPTIVSLQEVLAKDRDYMVKQGLFTTHSYSLDFRPPGPFDTTNRKLGCLIGVRGDVDVKNDGVLERTLFPDRTVFSEITIGGTFSFTTLCFHSLTGVGYKKAKTAQYFGVAEYLFNVRNQPIISCFDANEPEIDHIDLEKVKFFNQGGEQGKGAALILGQNPVHNMKDSYRIWLANNPARAMEIKKKQNQIDQESVLKYTPLAVSHIIRGNYHKRYDYIMISDHFGVKNVEYRLDEAIQAGSDHAMVIADLHFDFEDV